MRLSRYGADVRICDGSRARGERRAQFVPRTRAVPRSPPATPRDRVLRIRTVSFVNLIVTCSLGSACSSESVRTPDSGADATIMMGDAAEMDAVVADAGSFDVGPHDADVIVNLCVPATIPTSGFQQNQVVLETSHGECAAGVCMVFRLLGTPHARCSRTLAARLPPSIRAGAARTPCASRCRIPGSCRSGRGARIARSVAVDAAPRAIRRSRCVRAGQAIGAFPTASQAAAIACPQPC